MEPVPEEIDKKVLMLFFFPIQVNSLIACAVKPEYELADQHKVPHFSTLYGSTYGNSIIMGSAMYSICSET